MPDTPGRQLADADGHTGGPAGTARLLRRLRAMWCRLDPVPLDITLRVELALLPLLADVELLCPGRDDALVGARGDDVVRTLTFSGSTATVTVTVQPAVDGSFRIDGWLTPGEVREIVLRAPGAGGAAVGRTRSDRDGRFVVEGVPPGSVALVVCRAGPRRPAVLTPTVVLA